MTIVVWDGKTLAADRLASMKGPLNPVRYTEVNKIFIPTEKHLVSRGTPLEALCFSGSVMAISRFIDWFQKLPASKHIFTDIDGLLDQQLTPPEFSLIGLSESGVTTRNTSTEPVKQYGLRPNEFAALGSGAHLAYPLKERFPELDAVELVYLTMVLTQRFGGGISAMQSGDKKPKTIRELNNSSKTRLTSLLVDAINDGIYTQHI